VSTCAADPQLGDVPPIEIFRVGSLLEGRDRILSVCNGSYRMDYSQPDKWIYQSNCSGTCIAEGYFLVRDLEVDAQLDRVSFPEEQTLPLYHSWEIVFSSLVWETPIRRKFYTVEPFFSDEGCIVRLDSNLG